MRRRTFITLLGGAAVPSLLWPLAARAQSQSMPVIGYLDAGGPSVDSLHLGAFRKGLSQAGFDEGRNVAIEFRIAEQFDRLPALAQELVRLRVTVIFAASGTNVTLAAKAATTSIPIVFQSGFDPVGLGVVSSLSRPGGNITGVTTFTNELNPKRLELLRELVPQAGVIGFLGNPSEVAFAGNVSDLQAVARRIGQQTTVLKATNAAEIDRAFASAIEQRIDALLVFPSAMLRARAQQLAELAVKFRIPACYATREFVTAGGLISYGDDRPESLRQAGLYVGRILKGEKPSDLPVLQPSKFELVINQKAAKAIGLVVPPMLLARADEVIE